MGSFDIYSNYRNNAGVSGVVFGAEKGVLEVELNELQEISKHRLKTLASIMVRNGISDVSKITLSSDVLSVAACTFVVDGLVIDNTGLSIEVDDGDDIYLQVWEEQATYEDTLKLQGNQQESNTVTNWFLDNRGSNETSRRLVTKYQLAKSQDNTKINLKLATITSGSLVVDVVQYDTKQDNIVSATGVLDKTAWTTTTIGGESVYTQSISNANITATNTVMFEATHATQEYYADAECYAYAQAAGSIQFVATAIPEEDITINMVIVP